MDNFSKNVLVYIRVSSNEQKTGNGIEIQKSTIDSYLKNNGYDFSKVTTIEDLGVSAFRGDNISTESKLGKFIHEIKNPSGWVVVVFHLDRISRNGVWAFSSFLSSFILGGGSIVSASTQRVLDKNDSIAMIEATLAMNLSNMESQRKSNDKKKSNLLKLTRVLEKKEKEPNKFYAMTGIKTPKFIDVVQKDNDIFYEFNDFAKVIRTITNYFLNGYTSGYIVKKINADGFKYNTSSILALVKNENLFGRLITTVTEDSSPRIIDNFYPAIITKEQFSTIQSNIKKRSIVKTKIHKKIPAMFTGILKCSFCNSNLSYSVGWSGDTYYYYDTGQTKKAICKSGCSGNYNKMERVLVEYLFNVDWNSVFSDSSTVNDTKTSELKNLEIKYNSLNETIDSLRNNNMIPDSRMYLDLVTIKNEMERLNEEILLSTVGTQSFDYDIEELLDVNNVELRQRCKTRLIDLLSTILVKRKGHVVYLKVVFTNSKYQYIVYDNKSGKLLNSFDSDKIISGSINGEFKDLV